MGVSRILMFLMAAGVSSGIMYTTSAIESLHSQMRKNISGEPSPYD